QYDIRVRAIGEFRASVEGLKRMIVPSAKIGWVTLDNVVRVEEGTGPSAIDRLNRQRQVTLLANVRPGGSQADVIAKMNAFVNEAKIEAGYSTGLAGRSKELGRAGYYFMLAFVLSFVFMYMVLAAEFEKMNAFVNEAKIEAGYSTGLAGRSKELGLAGYYLMYVFVLANVFMYIVLADEIEKMNAFVNEAKIEAGYSTGLAGRSKEL